MYEERPTGTGYLILRVTTARGSIPLEGATVNLRSYDQPPLPQNAEVLYSITTGRDGKTPRLSLPAPSRAESQAPATNGEKPYSTYLAEVRMRGYRSQSFIGIPIFDGITALQAVDLVPLPENASPDGYQDREEQFFENNSFPSLSF